MTKVINVLAIYEHKIMNILNTQTDDILCADKVTMPIPTE